MPAIFLILIIIAIVIFFWTFLRVRHYFLDKKIRYAMVCAYMFQLIGVTGFAFYQIDIFTTPEFYININSNLPDFIRSLADLSYPLGAIILIFWFLPQLFNFLKDHRLSLPLFQAMRGNNLELPSYREISKKIQDLPLYKDMHPIQKEYISKVEEQLKGFDADEEKMRLLNYGTNNELIAESERAYNLIFGSQIQALQALKNNDVLDLTSFYENHKQKTQDAPSIRYNSFYEWVEFLVNAKLIEFTENKKYKITHKGDYIISYFVNNKLFLDKVF